MKRPLYVVVGCRERSIGAHVVSQLLGRGARVVAADRDVVVEGQSREGLLHVRCDVTLEAETQWLGSTVAKYQHDYEVRGVVYAAGINRMGSLLDLSLEDWEQTMAVNLTGAWLVTKALVQRLAPPTKTLPMVYVGSNTAFVPRTNSAAYGASKAGLGQMVRCLHRELAPKGYSLMTLDPGPVADTQMDADTAAALAESRGWNHDEYVENIAASVPMQRMASPQEIAQWVTFLLTNGAYAGGTSIRVDGGQVSGRG